MSRWDALKSNSSRTQTKTVQQRPRPRPNAPTNRRRPLSKASVTSTSSLEDVQQTLEQQWQLYQTQGSSFDPLIVQKCIDSMVSRKLTSSLSFKDITLLIQLLDIPDTSLQAKLFQHLPSIFQGLLSLSPQEANNCISTLVSKYCEKPNPSHAVLLSLTSLVTSQASILSAEHTTRTVLGPVMLQALQGPSLPPGIKQQLCELFLILLSKTPYSSALLAPLVQDVSEDGKESTLANPHRRLLFHALQSVLLDSTLPTTATNKSSDVDVATTQLRASACMTLSKAVEALRVHHEPLHHPFPQDLFNMPKLDNFLLVTMHQLSSPLFLPSITLFRSLLRSFPKATTRIAAKLLDPCPGTQAQLTSPSCPHCSAHFATIPDFVTFVHASMSLNLLERSLGALDTLTDLLQALPWTLWLRRPHATFVPTAFYRKVHGFLENILGVAKCLVVQVGQSTKPCPPAFVAFFQAIFLSIPWSQTTDALLLQGTKLWGDLTSLSLGTQIGNNQTAAVVTDMLIVTTGGKVTPNGTLSLLTLPGSRWMSSEASRPFVQKLLSSLDSNEASLRLFCALVRTRPQTAVEHWDYVEGAVRDFGDGQDVSQRKIAIGLLESVMLGWRDFPVDLSHSCLKAIHQPTKLAFEILHKTLDDEQTAILLQQMNVYVALSEEDWAYARATVKVSKLVSRWLALCSDRRGKVRSAACKATGEFCSRYLTSDVVLAPTRDNVDMALIPQICSTMVEVIPSDKNAPVRAMALFTLGNLAVSMNEFKATGLVAEEQSFQIVDVILNSMNDDNDKVVANAIRSIGHWGGIMAQKEGSANGAEERVVRIIHVLSKRLVQTVALSSSEKRAGLTWKERSSAKKHGWGCCNALGAILGFVQGRVLDVTALKDATFGGIVQLTECFKIHDGLTEKVVISVMAALRSLGPLVLGRLVEKTGLIGENIAICACLLHSSPRHDSTPRGTSTKLVEEATQLFSHLLETATISDVVLAMKSEEFTKEVLEYVYTWMIGNQMDSRAFELFALALQRQDLPLSEHVSLEQNFASRAAMLHKQELSVVLETPTSTATLDDEPDEL